MQEIRINLISPDGQKTVCWSLPGKNLREVIAINHQDPGGSCGGRGICGKCKIRVKGEVNPLTQQERDFLLPEELKLGLRLACFCTVQGPLDVYLDYAPQSEKSWKKAKKYQFKPLVKTESFFINGLDKSEPVPLLKRIANALPGFNLEITPQNINELVRLDREGRPAIELKALVFGRQAVKYVGREKRSAYGIALDIGTTSLFAYLADLENGDIIQAASATNMQRVHGSDVLSRVSYCLEKEGGLEELHMILINNINSLIDDLLQKSNLTARDLFKITAVGNPVMLHLLLGLSVKGFASTPYCGLFIDTMNLEASLAGIKTQNDTALIILPQVGGFVGADTIACLLNTPSQVKRFLLVDIGTNGEIVLANGNKLWAASAAAGPAFEGGRISSGMRAGPGAVDKVFFRNDGKIGFNTIGADNTKGLCGSGIIDLMAVLRRGKYIDEFGIINQASSFDENVRLQSTGNGMLLEITDPDSGGRFIITQQDIREVQLAKAAIRTGIDILLQQAEINIKDLEAVYLAGAFGNVLQAESCLEVGLIPPVSREKIVNIGNAAAEGALKALLSDAALAEANTWQNKLRYVELANHENFQDLFINNINFPDAGERTTNLEPEIQMPRLF
ncbi:MAG TPA: ASKHA domain-containing protein [Syntrophomonadaceae bacterium]|nr:ASKHA domain-containing protein [Syntrophomonadaceae bacterium]HRX21977.1 ASKHA domain-containing protein [Syntrophomonadaceae bacterium]